VHADPQKVEAIIKPIGLLRTAMLKCSLHCLALVIHPLSPPFLLPPPSFTLPHQKVIGVRMQAHSTAKHYLSCILS
jgi:hypothetical protein